MNTKRMGYGVSAVSVDPSVSCALPTCGQGIITHDPPFSPSQPFLNVHDSSLPGQTVSAIAGPLGFACEPLPLPYIAANLQNIRSTPAGLLPPTLP